jgi:hypothetical protein
MKNILTLIILFLLPLAPLSSPAETDFDFDAENENKSGTHSEEETGTGFPLRGKVSMESVRQIEGPSRWIRLGPALHLIFDYNSAPGLFYAEITGRYNRAYRLEGDSGYTIKNHEKELVLRELYWKKSFGAVTLSAGNIMTVWGKADLLPVTDPVSAIDRSEYFFARPEEARLGQNTLKLEYFGKKSDTSLLFIPYPRFDRFSDRDHPYSYLPGSSIEEKNDTREYEGGIRQNIRFHRGSLSLMGGWFNNREPLLSHTITPEGEILFFKEYKPGIFTGISTNLAFAPFLIKCDLAYYPERSLQKIDVITGLPGGITRGKRIDGTIGLDYNGGKAGMFILEISGSHIFEKKDELAQKRNVLLGSAGWSDTYFSDDLKVNAFCFFFKKVNNILWRIEGEYSFSDQFSVYIQYTGIVIGSGDHEYSRFNDYDRIDLALIYNFDMN